MAQFRKGAEAIEQAAQRQSSGKFMPVFKFEAGETKYVQFLMPIEEIPTVLMHQFIIVGQREDGTPKYERFISRRDPALDGSDGYDDLTDRFGLSPTNRSIALALEVEPVYAGGSGKRKVIDGFDLAERQFTGKDGDTVTVPAFGLIIESPRIFFTDLAVNAEMGKAIEETVWAVKRTGKSTDTAYTFIDTGVDALDVEEELEAFSESFDFDDYLDMLSDEDRMRELVGELPDDAKVSMFDKKKGGAKQEDKPARASSRRRAVAKAEEPAEDRDFEGEDSENEDGEKEAAPNRKSRFAELRGATTKASE